MPNKPQIPEKISNGSYEPTMFATLTQVKINQLIDWAHSVEERLNNDVVEKPEVFSLQVTPDKVEEIVTYLDERLITLGDMKVGERRAVIKDKVTELLTQHHQDLISKIIKDVTQMWVDELCRENREEGATAIGYSKVVAYLSNLSK